MMAPKPAAASAAKPRWRLLVGLFAAALAFIVWDANRAAPAAGELAVVRAERPARSGAESAALPAQRQADTAWTGPRTRLVEASIEHANTVDLFRVAGTPQATNAHPVTPAAAEPALPARVLGSTLLDGRRVLVLEHDGDIVYAAAGQRAAGLRVDRVDSERASVTELASGARHDVMLDTADGVQGLQAAPTHDD